MATILDFWKIHKLLKLNTKLTKNVENVSHLLKLNISMEKREIKMYFKQIYVKILKTAFEKVVAMSTA